VLGDEAAGVLAGAAGIPAERARPGQPAKGFHGARDVVAFLGLGHAVVVDPAPAVGGDLVAILDEGGRGFAVAFERHGDGEDRKREPALAKQPQDSPHPGAAAVLVERFHAHVPGARVGHGADDLGKEGLGGRIAMQHRALRAFLVVEDELQRDAGSARPVGVGRPSAVADEVARIGWLCQCRAERWVRPIA
jgi:hypothetical protein